MSKTRGKPPGPVVARATRLRKLRGKFPASMSSLQNWCQTGRLERLGFRDDGAEGPSHAQVFVNTATATLPDDGGRGTRRQGLGSAANV